MKFTQPVKEAVFRKRYKRFFADVELDGEVVTAHVPNTGSMKGCLWPDVPCRITFDDNPQRKLKFTLQMIKAPTSWVGVNTHLSNQLVWEAWESNASGNWATYTHGQREVKIHDKTRVDLVLWKNPKGQASDHRLNQNNIHETPRHFVEVKNVTLAEGSVAKFPDAVTARGQKHIEDLVALIDQGHSAELLYTVQRTDCQTFQPADDIDPEYGRLLRWAKKKGLAISAYPVKMTSYSVDLLVEKPLRIDL